MYVKAVITYLIERIGYPIIKTVVEDTGTEMVCLGGMKYLKPEHERKVNNLYVYKI